MSYPPGPPYPPHPPPYPPQPAYPSHHPSPYPYPTHDHNRSIPDASYDSLRHDYSRRDHPRDAPYHERRQHEQPHRRSSSDRGQEGYGDRRDDHRRDRGGSWRRSRSRSPPRRVDVRSEWHHPPQGSRFQPSPLSSLPRPPPPPPLSSTALPLPPPPPPPPRPHEAPLIRLTVPSPTPRPSPSPPPPPSSTPSPPSSHSAYLLPPDSSPPSSTPPRYAYVWLVMKGDSYIPGALTSAYSVFLTSTPHPLLCMVTPDVTPHGRSLLSLLFHSVIEVAYITAHTRHLRTSKQQTLYQRWVEQSFTKWQLLQLTAYDKLLFIDADKVVLHNIDHLFDLPTPAATFSSPWASTYIAPSRKRGAGLSNPYAALRHGDAVPHAAVEAGLHTNSFVCIGTMVLLRPSVEAYQRYLDMLRPYMAEGEEGGKAGEEGMEGGEGKEGGGGVVRAFGFESCHSMMDEQSLCLLYHAQYRRQWTYIHQRYNFVGWHRNWLTRDDLPYVLHFFSTKPWVLRRTEYLDLEVWWTLATAMVRDGRWTDEQRQMLRGAFEKEQLEGERLDGCSWCKEDGRDDWSTHRMLDDRGRMQCPRMLQRKPEAGVADTSSSAEVVRSSAS